MSLRRLLLATCMAAVLAGPVRADPITGAIAAVSGWVASSAIASTFLQLGVGLALSAWQRARAPRAEKTGIRIDQVLTGDTNPESFTLGRSATAGASIGPYRSHGRDNGWLTMVIDLGGVPGMALEAVFVNGEHRPLRYDRPRGDLGIPVEQETDDKGREGGDFLLYVKFYDGSQAAADPHLLAAHGSDPEYPWTADMIGRGRCYAIVTAKYHREKQTSIPQIKFGLRGIPLYDPRRDATAGGVGPQRWSQPETWAYTENAAVQAYNLLRGIPVGPDLYGGRVPAVNLPQGTFLTAMNEADRLIEELGGPVPQFRAGIEVEVDQAPAEVAETLLRTCSGALAETGGVWSIRVGAPAAPVHLITDDDVVVTRPQQLDPFPGLDQTINGITVTHPDPATAWEMREAPPIVRLDLETRDDNRRLRESLALDACAYGGQVQRVARAYLEDSRRFARHSLPLPPDARHLRVLDTLAWRSERNQYGAKLFEVTERTIDLSSYLIELTLREVDPGDYEWTSDLQLPVATPPIDRTAPVIEPPDFEVEGVAIPDGAGVDRRAALRVRSEDARLDVEVRLTLTQQQVVVVPDAAIGAGLTIQAGILPDQFYDARVRYAAAGLAPEWSGWQTTKTPDLRLGVADLDEALRRRFDDAEEVQALELLAFVDALDAQERAETVAAGLVTTAQEVDTLTQSFGEATGTFEEVRALAVGTEVALADYQREVSASFVELVADVIVAEQAIATIEGFAFASAGVTVETTDGGIAGFRATSFTNPDGTGGAVLDLLGSSVRAGTMSLDRLVVGQGRNRLEDSELAEGTRFWSLEREGAVGAGAVFGVVAPGQPYSATADNVLSLTVPAGASGGVARVRTRGMNPATKALVEASMSVVPGEHIFASARMIAVGAPATIGILWRRVDGTVLSRSEAEVPASAASPTLSARRWERHGIRGEAPAEAASAQLEVGIAAPGAVHWWEPQIEETHAAATQPTPYSGSGVTLIGPGRIVVPSLDALSANLGTIMVGSANIENGAISNAKIANAAINTAKIGDLQVNTIKIARGSITTAASADLKNGGSVSLACTADADLHITIIGFADLPYAWDTSATWGGLVKLNGSTIGSFVATRSYSNDGQQGGNGTTWARNLKIDTGNGGTWTVTLDLNSTPGGWGYNSGLIVQMLLAKR